MELTVRKFVINQGNNEIDFFYSPCVIIVLFNADLNTLIFSTYSFKN